MSEYTPDLSKGIGEMTRDELEAAVGFVLNRCKSGPHRLPEGPNEDVGQCPDCWCPIGVMRPEGETFGDHLADCSLPIRHPGYCEPGGSGHPRAEHVRG